MSLFESLWCPSVVSAVVVPTVDRDVNAARNILSFATGGEPGIARGLGKNLSDHVSGTKVEARTEAEKFDEAVRLERAA